MPYRRLPNTDLARIRAMQAAIKKGNILPPFQLAFSQSLLVKVKPFLPLFENAVEQQRKAIDVQANKNKDYSQVFKKAQMYVSHFIQVLNFAIIRGELPVKVRNHYGFDLDSNRVPNLNSEEELIEVGAKLIKGEHMRTLGGGTPILNPKISLVSMHYEKFLEMHNNQKKLKENSAKANNNVASLRVKADQLILDLWNEIEQYFNELEPNEKRKKCEEYGLVYVFRKSEKQSISRFMQLSA
jgi:hypothetical protein